MNDVSISDALSMNGESYMQNYLDDINTRRDALFEDISMWRDISWKLFPVTRFSVGLVIPE
jgi:predicted transposase YbfD/YdcC